MTLANTATLRKSRIFDRSATILRYLLLGAATSLLPIHGQADGGAEFPTSSTGQDVSSTTGDIQSVLREAVTSDEREEGVPPRLPGSEQRTATVRQDAPQVPDMTQAQGEALTSAIAHFNRSRALLLSAIREFDEGLKFADSAPLVDSQRWRRGVISYARELERVLAPRSRTSRGGVRLEGDSRLLSETNQ